MRLCAAPAAMQPVVRHKKTNKLNMKNILLPIFLLWGINLSAQNCFEIGSSERTVRSVQGTPSSVQDYSFFIVWSYGSSSITFENGRVKSYDNWSNNLKICTSNSRTTQSSSRGCFEIGSSKNTVKNAQGTPSSIQDYSFFVVWSYGSSSVTFEKGRVKSYNNWSNNLRICDSNEANYQREQPSYDNTPNYSNSTDNSDVGFDPFIGITTSNVNFRTGPSTSNSRIKTLGQGTQIYVFSNSTKNGYYKAIDIATSQIGWVHKNYVRYIESVDINESNAFQSTGYTSNYNSEISIRNKSSYTIKLIVGDETYTISSYSTKIVNITPGRKYYIASAPGVIPASGYQNFQSNNGYEWEFWVSTSRY